MPRRSRKLSKAERFPASPTGELPEIHVDPFSPEELRAMRSIEDDVIEEVGLAKQAKGIHDWVPSRFELDLADLSKERRDYWLDRIDSIMNMREIMDQFGPPGFINPRDIVGRLTPADRPIAAYQQPLEEMTHPRAAMISREYLQYRPEEGTEAWQQYLPRRTRRMRVGYAEELVDQIQDARAGGMPHGKFMVLDTETAGLKPELGMRELAYRIYDEDGNEVEKKVMHMKNNFFKWGSVGTQSLEEFRKSDLGASTDVDFMEGMQEFIRDAKSVDFQIAAYNAPFDLNFLITGMKGHSAYRNNPEYKVLVDEYQRSMNQSGKMIDLADMVRVGLGLKEIAPELEGSNTPASFQNVLLQTNLLDIIERSGVPRKEIREHLTALHTGQQDTWLEGFVRRFYPQLTKGPVDRRKWAAEIESITNATAYAPGIRLPAHQIDPSIKGFLEAQGMLDEQGAHRVTAFEQMMIQMTRNAPQGVAGPLQEDVAARAYNEFFSPFINTMSSEETSRDQNLIKRIGPGLPDDILRSYPEFQRRMMEAGGGYGDLSAPERILSAIASGHQNRIREGTEAEEKFRSVFGGALPVPRFHAMDSPKRITDGIIGLPLDILHDVLGDEEALRMGELSPFKTSVAGIKDVGVNIRFKQQEHFDKVMEMLSHAGDRHVPSEGGPGLVLKGFESYGITPKVAKEMREVLEKHGQLAGIQIATMGQFTQEEHGPVIHTGEIEAARLHDALTEMSQGITTEYANTSFGVILGQAGRDIEDRGTRISTGPIVSQAATDAERLTRIEGEIPGVGLKLSESWKRFGSRNFHTLRASIKHDWMTEEGASATNKARRLQLIENADRLYDKFKPHTKVAAGVGIAAVLGTIAFRKHQERKRANESVLQQPTQLGRLASAPTDYLATAGITRTLDQNKIGHFRMGADKNQHLFGGY